ncbi:helix-turn-helix domain-containing protein [Halobacillus campisalis]|uniref:Helix-turn-helix domain-containing protein n=2 Tax=Halobacillus campisalis TaxID=435909 RepID=A0ABW2K2V0_9BACI|nr:helix-turn-helix domain-containing protein [Halobacillus campisalis]
MEIGSRLREAREAKKLTLEEVQNTTKIQKRYLQAIENNEFGILPGKFYTRAFIREYASAVGLDPEQVMEEHKNELPSNEEEQVITYSRVQQSKSEKNPSSGGGFAKSFPTILTVFLVVGLLFAVWFFILQLSNSNNSANDEEMSQDQVNVTDPSGEDDESQDEENSSSGGEGDSSDSSEEEANEENSSEEVAEEIETEDDQDQELEFSLEETGAGQFPEHVYNVSGAEERELTIAFNSETYLELNAPKDGESLADARNYSQDDEEINMDISDYAEVYVRTGSAPGMTVMVNGEEIEFPTDNLTQKLLIQFE